jgi:hypothetical protein
VIYYNRYDDYNYHKFRLKRGSNTSLNRPVIRKINKKPDFTAQITKKEKERNKQTNKQREREKETPNESAQRIQTAAQNNNKTATDLLSSAAHKILPSSSSFSKCPYVFAVHGYTLFHLRPKQK